MPLLFSLATNQMRGIGRKCLRVQAGVETHFEEVGRSGTHSMQEWAVMVRNLAGAGKGGVKKWGEDTCAGPSCTLRVCMFVHPQLCFLLQTMQLIEQTTWGSGTPFNGLDHRVICLETDPLLVCFWCLCFSWKTKKSEWGKTEIPKIIQS